MFNQYGEFLPPGRRPGFVTLFRLNIILIFYLTYQYSNLYSGIPHLESGPQTMFEININRI